MACRFGEVSQLLCLFPELAKIVSPKATRVKRCIWRVVMKVVIGTQTEWLYQTPSPGEACKLWKLVEEDKMVRKCGMVMQPTLVVVMDFAASGLNLHSPRVMSMS